MILIAGPTAVGKTDLAIRLAEHFSTEIISADARQVYREMVIGTAQPTTEQLSRVRHHFVASRSIQDEYNAADFGDDALKTAEALFRSHDYVVVCGGSGLYIKAMLEGFDEMPEIEPGIREGIVSNYESKGLTWLQDEVKKRDPEYFTVVDQKNPHRLTRALELFLSTGKKMSELRKNSRRELPFKVSKIGLTLPTEVLYARINQRVDEMMLAGLVDEVRQLLPFKHLNALNTVGYTELFGYLEGQYDLEEAVRLLKQNTRHYAKRQMTWFRKDKEINWIQPDQWNELLNLVK